MIEHSRSGYTEGCRCSICTAANRDYARAWYAEQRRLVAVGKAFEKFMREQGKS